jgi:hypothetical protein
MAQKFRWLFSDKAVQRGRCEKVLDFECVRTVFFLRVLFLLRHLSFAYPYTYPTPVHGKCALLRSRIRVRIEASPTLAFSGQIENVTEAHEARCMMHLLGWDLLPLRQHRMIQT